MGTNQEHDSFVRDYFSKPDRARDLFRIALSRELREILDIDKLAMCPDNYFKRGRERRPDRVYRIPLKSSSERFVYLPMEHKSYQEKEIYDQVQDTIDAIRESIGTDAIIVPFVFYQRETPWPYPKSLAEGWDISEEERAQNLPLEIFDLGDGEIFLVRFSSLTRPHTLPNWRARRARPQAN